MSLPADQILTQKEFEALIQGIAVTLAGLDPNSGVRIEWPPDGQPDWQTSTDVVFVGARTEPDAYSQQREKVYGPDMGDGINTQISESYVRVWAVEFTVYGPNADVNSAALLDGLYSETTQETLIASNVAMILDTYAVTWVPELFNGQWWGRGVLTVRFNEGVIRYNQVPYLESAQITLEAETSGSLFEEVITP